jgi:selenocysteine lyase/cysteine desulfurase
MSPDFVALREEFPSLEERAYLVTHSFGLCPRPMFDDLAAYRETLARRPTLFHEWFERLEEMYGLVERLLGAPPGSVALRESASACHATVLSCLQASSERSRLVASAMQFPSISYMVAAQSRRGFEVELVPASDGVQLDADAIAARLDSRSVAVFAPVVASFNGSLLNVSRLVEAAHDVGAIPILDAYSALGVVPIDVSQLPPCVLIGGTMKWLGGGGTGLAFMYVHPELIERLPVAYPGWLGDAQFMDFSPDFTPAPGARRYQLGTPAMEPVYTARAGLKFVLAQGVDQLRARNLLQLELLARRASELGLKANSPSNLAKCAGLLAIEVDDAHAVVRALKAEGFEIDTRNRRSVRLGPHWCVTLEECERAIQLVAQFARA